MKIEEPSWSERAKELNQAAFDNPEVGDYWSEMFCPYFVIVDIQGDDYTILCAWEDRGNVHVKNAKVEVSDGWYFDVNKHSVVTKEWIQKKVTYESIPWFVADVTRNFTRLVDDWKKEHPNYTPERHKVKYDDIWFLGV